MALTDYIQSMPQCPDVQNGDNPQKVLSWR